MSGSSGPGATPPDRTSPRRPGLGVLQRLGRSLMLPIAALPVAAILLRLGQPDMLGAGDSGLALASHWPWMAPVAEVLSAAGGALFANLGLLFAVGVAVGFARKSDGSTALAAVVGYLVFEAVTGAMSPRVLTPTRADPDPVIDYGVFGGIVLGITAALLWQRFYRTRLPPYLAFFGGRRFVPIITSVVQLAFFLTPIVWVYSDYLHSSNPSIAERARLAELNPFLHFVEFLRRPMLGQPQELRFWVVVVCITVVGWALTLVALRRYRSRVSYWV